MHESFTAAQLIMRGMQRVIDNIFLIKILRTSESEFEDYKINLKKFTNAQFNNIKFGIINSLVPNFSALIILSVLVAFLMQQKLLLWNFLVQL